MADPRLRAGSTESPGTPAWIICADAGGTVGWPTSWRSWSQAAKPRIADPLDDIEMKRTVGLIRTLLGELPLKQREVFDLVDLQGLKPKEAAEMLEMNPNTARVHLLRARRTMRREMLARDHGYGGVER